MKPRSFVRAFVMPAAFLLGMTSIAFGQGVTTAAVNGTILDRAGQPIENVVVTAVHTPSGSRYQTLSRADGRFNLPGLRVGGPYTISAEFIGYATESVDNVRLSLGEDRRIQFTLLEEAVQLQGIEVVAERGAIMSSSRMGAQRSISTEEIESLPTIARSVQDFARLTPQAVGTNIGSSENIGGTSIGGKNNRFNNIQVDGAILNDVFGLPASGTPGGQANSQPISLDAVQEFQVALSPFDIRQGGFTGGSVNIITRSGTNRYEGSAYFFGRNDSFVGQLNDQDIAQFDELQTGLRLGGPLQKDKAFFFLSGEIKQTDRPLELGLFGSSLPNTIDISQAQVDSIISIARSTYSHDPGNFTTALQRATDDFKIFGRLDFNLSDKHHLTVRHNHVDATSDRGIRRNSFEAGLGSQGYAFDAVSNSSVLQLDSRFKSNLANMFRFAYQRQRDKRTPDLAPFPEVDIEPLPFQGESIVLGTERFSQQNALDQDVFEITDDLTYWTGDHAITIGTHNEFFSFSNLFIQDAFGQYEFEGAQAITDFANGTPSRYRVSISKTSERFPSIDWSAFQLGFYAQDAWQVSPRVNITLGLRADIPIVSDDPAENASFAAAFPGFHTSKVPSGNILWSPRFGFNADLDGQRNTQLRGGAGVFSGRNPFVWLSNQYSNTGLDFIRIDCRASRGCAVPAFQPDPFNQPLIAGGVSTTTEVDITDPDFKFPQAFRSNLAIDHQLVPGLIGTVEGIYTKTIKDIIFQDLSIVEAGNAIDGRKLFSDTPVAAEFSPGVFLLTNTEDGYSAQITGQLRKQLGEGFLPDLSGSLAYTYTKSQDVNSGTSSRSISNFQFNEIGVDPNNPGSATSDFEIQHRIVADASYRVHYGDGWSTTLTAFYVGRSGRPFNWIYSGDANNDGRRSNDLIFVPATASDAIFDQGTFAQWDAFVSSDDGLAENRGRIVERNSSREPWVNQLDLRLAQVIPSVRGHNLEITLDVVNFLNLLNSDWGHQEFVSFQSKSILSFRGYDSATGKPIVRFTQSDTNNDGVVTRDDIFNTDNILSRWAIQLGARYSFGF
ncbi:MAG: carboxypeptidase regulatory-like domain-containing protein [Gemmatimonadota bacterium]